MRISFNGYIKKEHKKIRRSFSRAKKHAQSPDCSKETATARCCLAKKHNTERSKQAHNVAIHDPKSGTPTRHYHYNHHSNPSVLSRVGILYVHAARRRPHIVHVLHGPRDCCVLAVPKLCTTFEHAERRSLTFYILSHLCGARSNRAIIVRFDGMGVERPRINGGQIRGWQPPWAGSAGHL